MHYHISHLRRLTVRDQPSESSQALSTIFQKCASTLVELEIHFYPLYDGGSELFFFAQSHVWNHSPFSARTPELLDIAIFNLSHMANLCVIEFEDWCPDNTSTRSGRYERILKTLSSSAALITTIFFFSAGSVHLHSSDWDRLDSTLFSMNISATPVDSIQVEHQHMCQYSRGAAIASTSENSLVGSRSKKPLRRPFDTQSKLHAESQIRRKCGELTKKLSHDVLNNESWITNRMSSIVIISFSYLFLLHGLCLVCNDLIYWRPSLSENGENLLHIIYIIWGFSNSFRYVVGKDYSSSRYK